MTRIRCRFIASRFCFLKLKNIIDLCYKKLKSFKCFIAWLNKSLESCIIDHFIWSRIFQDTNSTYEIAKKISKFCNIRPNTKQWRSVEKVPINDWPASVTQILLVFHRLLSCFSLPLPCFHCNNVVITPNSWHGRVLLFTPSPLKPPFRLFSLISCLVVRDRHDMRLRLFYRSRTTAFHYFSSCSVFRHSQTSTSTFIGLI